MLPYGRQSIDEDDVAAVADGAARRLAHHRPGGRRLRGATSPAGPAAPPCVAVTIGHGGPARRLRGGRGRPRRRGGHHAADVRGHREPRAALLGATVVFADVERRHRQPRPGGRRGRCHRAGPGSSPRSTTPATRPTTTRCARSPTGAGALLLGGRRALDRRALPRPAGGHARRPDHVLVLPDQEPDHRRGRRRRQRATRTLADAGPPVPQHRPGPRPRRAARIPDEGALAPGGARASA